MSTGPGSNDDEELAPDSISGAAGTLKGDLADGKLKPDAAFDLWLERGLHTLFDDIAQEPLPPALVDIIEQDRDKG